MEKYLICYCLGYSEEDIIEAVLEHGGSSSILEKILCEMKKGTCRCGATHPPGR